MSDKDILEIILGQHDLATRAWFLRMWQQTLKSYMPKTEPEAGRFEDLMEWLETIVQALEAV